jgi:hypothetical protein
MSWGKLAGQSGEGRKPFFFEKKNQKTSLSLGSLCPERPQPKESKVFCFFFSKKKRLLLRCCLHPIALGRLVACALPQAAARRGVAALEFALVAPVMAIMFFGTLDICRAYLAWQEVNDAAEAIVQAAEKLSITANSPTTQLTAAQMQAAMSSIYVEMPGLDYGFGDGLLGTGQFTAILSEVDFAPLCATTANCAPQTPQTLWSSWLTEGGSSPPLMLSTAQFPLYRACGPLTPVARFPNDDTQLTTMITPTKTQIANGGSAGITLVPQLVADVRFTFIPTFHVFVPQVVFWASASLPAPLGPTSQEVTFSGTPVGSNPQVCPAPAQPS